MTYSGDPSDGDLDAIRFWLQDTGSPELLSDNELRYFISYAADYSDDALLLASALCAVIQAKYAGEGRITGDGISYDFTQVQDKYGQLAVSLRAQWTTLNASKGLPFDGSSMVSAACLRYGQRPPLFSVGQFDNPRGPSQLWDSEWDIDDGDVFIYPGGGG